MKFLLLMALCLVVGTWLVRAAGARSGGAAGSAKKTGTDGEAMVRCLQCGVHFPRSEAIVNAAGMFCSEEHRRRHAES